MPYKRLTQITDDINDCMQASITYLHRFKILIDKLEVLDPNVALHVKIDILTSCDDTKYFCYLCKESLPHEELK